MIAAYARMERVLGAHGVARKPSDSPLEHLANILRELDVRAAAVLDLTQLFTCAKFSQHEIDPAMREESIGALQAVRADLKAAG